MTLFRRKSLSLTKEKMLNQEISPLQCIHEWSLESNDISFEKLNLQWLFPYKPDAFAVILDNVFTKEECDKLIELTEQVSYQEALVGYGQVRVSQTRNNWRCIIDDPIVSNIIFSRIKDYIPTKWLGKHVSNLNERLRFLKYNPGEYFKPHNDGIYIRDDQSQLSYVTIHLYLNDVIEGDGGETTFTTEKLSYGRPVKKSQVFNKRLSVQPKVGRILIFEHHLSHEGSTLTKGVKYTMRTDVMYDNPDGKPIIRAPRWGVPFPKPQYKLPEIFKSKC